MKLTIVTFGEAEKGRYFYPYTITCLPQLAEKLGHPPQESQGLFFAIQSLLYDRQLIFFRVEEEGFNDRSYFKCFYSLEKKNFSPKKISALCLPGVGDPKILDSAKNVQKRHDCILIITQKDLFDYLTSISHSIQS